MIYGSVCSGIEAATVAWAPLGWRAAFFAEIEPFPSAVLAHHYPAVPNLGDFTRIGKDVPCEPIDLLVGGTPCQSFSIAGLRAGLDDPRGNLALEFLALADRLRPRWLVWENVPGVLSSVSDNAPDPAPPAPPLDVEREGQVLETEDEHDCEELHALNCFLAGLSELGYGWAMRVLDAQFFELAQRRARVFVVAHLGAWQPAAAVLLEPEGMRGDPPPSRAPWEETARPLAGCPQGGSGYRNDADTADNLVAGTLRGGSSGGNSHGKLNGSDEMPMVACALTASRHGYRSDSETETLLAHALTAEGFDASEDGTGRGTPLVPCAMQEDKQNGVLLSDIAGALRSDAPGSQPCGTLVAFHGSQDPDVSGDVTHPLGRNHGLEACVAFDTTQITSKENRCRPEPGDPCHPIAAEAHAPAIASSTAVRRLTPSECERLQGFPDDYTLVPIGGGQAKDGPRYRAIGNSFAVTVVRWIGRRIDAVDRILQEA